MIDSEIFQNKTILITGGTGSFGNAVASSFLSSKISEIRIFSRDEKKQDDMRKKYQNEKFNNWKTKWQKRLTKDSNNLMRCNNPKIIPRNHIVENVLKSAENNDLRPFNDFLEILKNPYSNQNVLNKYQSAPLKKDEKYQTFCGT